MAKNTDDKTKDLGMSYTLKNRYYKTKESVMLVKAPPMMPPTISYVLDAENKDENNLKDNLFQFAYRYHYNDGEISAISHYSKVAFRSLLGTKDLKDSTVVTAVSDANHMEITTKNIDKNTESSFPVTLVSNTLTSFDYTKIADDDYKGVICYRDANNALMVRVIRFTKDSYRNIETYNLNAVGVRNAYNLRVYMVKDGSGAHFVSYKSDRDLYVYNSYGQKVHWIGANYSVLNNNPIAVSSNGKYVYAGYNDELGVSTKYGGKGTFNNTLHVDENSDPKGTDIFSQGAVVAVSCSPSGKQVYALVVDRKNNKNIKIARSNDYGSIWEISANHDVGSIAIKGADIATNNTGTKVILSYVLPNKIVFKESNNGGKTFSTNKEYAVDIKHSGDSYFMNMASDGNSLYIGYVNQSNKGIVAKSINNGTSFSVISTTTDSVLTDNAFSFSSELEDTVKYDNNFIQNDISSITITGLKSGITHQVKYIELIAIDVNNRSIAYSIIKDTPDNLDSYEFKNDSTYKLIPQKDVLKLYDNVPLKARCLSTTQNSLIFGGYTDGYSVEQTIGVTMDIISGRTSDNTLMYSLKHGISQSYAIIYYDKFGRSSDAIPIGDIDIPDMAGLSNYDTHISLHIKGNTPSWADYYAIAKKPLLLQYDTIGGFDSAHIYNDKLYLEYTGYKEISIQEGGRIKLILEPSTGATFGLATIPFEMKVNSEVEIIDNLVDTDGTTVLLPNGRYIVCTPVDIAGYKKSEVVSKASKFTSSVFYAYKAQTIKSDKIYQELPHRYKIVNRIHQGDSIANGITTLNLYDDYDVVIAKDYPTEVYKINKNTKINNLGRPNLDSDNFAQIDRYASLCASEVYVDDTNFNGFSSFNLWLQNYTDLEKHDGDIRLIESEDTNVEVYQRDSASKVLYKKNILSMADGSKAITQTQDIWGEQTKYAGEFGLSHPGSFSKWGTNRYYVDANRNVVLRKASNGIFPISSYGMTDYFHDYLESVKYKRIQGYYEPEYNMYHVCSDDNNLAFSEKTNGWEYRCSLFPDIISNDDNSIYSFKDKVLFKHNVGLPNNFYKVDYDAKIQTFVNDNPDITKVFNAIMLNGSKPLKIDFKVENNGSSITEPMFGNNGLSYVSCIPMGVDYKLAPRKIIGTVSSIVPASNTIPLTFVDSDIHVGDEILKYDNVTGNMTKLGVCQSINVGNIQIDSSVSLAINDVIMALDTLAINGDNLKDRKIMIDIEYKKGEPFSLESIVLDVDYQQN